MIAPLPGASSKEAIWTAFDPGEVPVEIEAAHFFREPAGAIAITNQRLRFIRSDDSGEILLSIAVPLSEIREVRRGHRRWIGGSGHDLEVILRRTGLAMRFSLLSGGVGRSEHLRTLAASAVAPSSGQEAGPCVRVSADPPLARAVTRGGGTLFVWNRRVFRGNLIRTELRFTHPPRAQLLRLDENLGFRLWVSEDLLWFDHLRLTYDDRGIRAHTGLDFTPPLAVPT